MPDTYSKEKRSEVMAAVGNRDTSPEIRLRKELWHRGLRYRLNERVEGRRPDIVFKGPEVVVYVDGCFWHGCPQHYTPPENNADFWRRKLERNRERDRRDERVLAAAGWTVLRFWECEVRRDVTEVADEVAGAMGGPRGGSSS